MFRVLLLLLHEIITAQCETCQSKVESGNFFCYTAFFSEARGLILALFPPQLMCDGTAKINLAKPESPYEMTPLGAPFHISPEMYQYHGSGHLSYVSYDIYAFGMLLWVLCEGTGTARPEVYQDLETIEAMKKVVVEGVVPKRLPMVSDARWELMKRCWHGRESLQMVHLVTKLQLILEACLSEISEK